MITATFQALQIIRHSRPATSRHDILPLRFHETELVMRSMMAAILLFGLLAQRAYAQLPESERKNIADNPDWTTPQKPFRIYGNTWYVGPRGLGVFLITAPTGDVLIDGGVPGEAGLIEGNIRTLGVNPRDVKWILVSHAHSDHAGGVAQLARDVGASVIAGAADTPLLERGGHGDPEYGDRFPVPPVPDFEHSFGVVAALRCDIPLAPHPGMVDFWERVARRNRGDVNALVDPAGCSTYANTARGSFEAKLAKQRAAATTSTSETHQ
jgi:hypothetical protein